MTCLSTTYSNCIVFSVDLRAALKSKGFNSTNLEEFILELVAKESLSNKVAALETALSGISAGNLSSEAKTYGLRTGASEIVKLQNRSVEYSVDNKALTYDFSHLIEELPEGIVYLGARVDVVDESGKRASIKGKRNVLSINTPSTVTFALDLKGATGNWTLSKQVAVNGDVDHKPTLLNDVQDFTTGAGNLTIKEHLEALSSKVALLETRL